MLKYIMVGIAVIVALGVGAYAIMRGKPSTNTPPPSTSGQAMGAATSTYATTTYSIIYPSSYAKDESYAYDQFGPTKLIHGVKFTIDPSIATGTNLAPDSYISVEQLPRAKKCTADIYIQQDVKAATMSDGGVQYSVATSSDAGAGNVYDETVYALVGSSPCTAVRYFIHSGNIGNYPPAGQPGAVQEFNRSALVSAFDTIRHSLQMNGAAPSAMQPTMQP